jgi:hypothetical protein
MRSLSAQNILRAWEVGQLQHPIDRALTLLAFAHPEKVPSELVSLSIGQRDGYLLTLREQTLGSKLDGFTECPRCHERLEFDLDISAIRFVSPIQSSQSDYSLAVEGFDLRFRLPNSQDLASIVGCQDADTARLGLIERCLLEVSYKGKPVPSHELPEAAIAQLTERIVEYDPQAEVLLPLTCAACGHAWSTVFDIVDFFWTELSALAQRLLLEVHLLAQTYGWREADILSMSAIRRQYYLNLMG